MSDSSDVPESPRGWTPAERFAFRAAFVYFAAFGVASLLDVGPAPRALLAAVYDPIVRWFGRSLLGVNGAPNDPGVPWALTRQLVAVVVAVAIAAVWSVVSQRTEYRRLHGWMRLVLRYYIAVVMLVYGGFKIVNTQFPAPSLDQLAQPLGSLSPMGLLWSFMGYSALYSSFAGLGEAIGAVLLFFRRTTTAGALVLVGVLSNVALLNYAYDVPVKQLSVNLLLGSIALLVPDMRRLVAMLIFNLPTQPANLTFDLPRWLQRVRRVLKPAIIVVATCVPLGISFRIQSTLARSSELAGIYDVDRFVRNGTEIPPLVTDAERWRQVVFGRPGAMSVRLMSDSVRYFYAAIDTSQHRVTLRPRADQNRRIIFDYEQGSEPWLRMRGVNGGDTLDVTLRRLDHGRVFRLVAAVIPSGAPKRQSRGMTVISSRQASSSPSPRTGCHRPSASNSTRRAG